MSKIVIYYFSASGNSLAVARDIATRLHGQLVPVVPFNNRPVIETDADVVGFVFPIYDFKAPAIVESMVRHLSDFDKKYVFAVCTYGIMPLKTMKRFQSNIVSSGGKLSGGFSVRMPHNGLGCKKLSDKKMDTILQECKQKCDFIVHYVESRKEGCIECSSALNPKLIGIFLTAIPLLLPLLKQVITKGWSSLSLYADTNCDGCGVCEKICPMDNITMQEKVPVWSDKCITCFACLHWCPTKAIQVGNFTKKMFRYHHPMIHLKDIINQKYTTF